MQEEAEADAATLRQTEAITAHQAHLDQRAQIVAHQAQKVTTAETRCETANTHREIVKRAHQGASSQKFSTYLSRAPLEEQVILRHVMDEAQEVGAKKRGRKPAGDSDPRKAHKKRRAEKARERRALTKAMPVTDVAKERTERKRQRHREVRRDQRSQERLSKADVTPHERRHAQRMAKLSPDKVAQYEKRLDLWRERRVLFRTLLLDGDRKT